MNDRKPLNITLIIHALHGGGAERIAATMANHWVEQSHRVTLVTLDRVASDHYPVNHRVRRVGLDAMRVSDHIGQAVVRNIQRISLLRDAIRSSQPDCVVSLTDQMNTLTLFATRRLHVPVVIAEHSDPRHQRMPFPWELLRNRAYPRCAAAVVLTRPIADYFAQRWKINPVYRIPNGIGQPDPDCNGPADKRETTILAMGRLSPEKGFDILIRAFAGFAAEHPQWHLRILGEGPARDQLKTQIGQLHLEGRVHLAGWVDRPHVELRRAAVFVLPSRYEGFPMSLLEAMSCGLPAISFDGDGGQRDIIRHEVDGLLVPTGDSVALGTAIQRMIQDPAFRSALSRRAPEVTNRFGETSFFQLWDSVLQEVLHDTPVD